MATEVQTLDNNEIVTFTAEADSIVQAEGDETVKFATDNTAKVWGTLDNNRCLEVPSGTVVYFKSKIATYLAVVEF